MLDAFDVFDGLMSMDIQEPIKKNNENIESEEGNDTKRATPGAKNNKQSQFFRNTDEDDLDEDEYIEEEEEEVEEEEVEENEETTDGPLTPFYNLLVKDNLITPVEKFDGSLESFKTAVHTHFTKLKDEALNDVIEELPEELKLVIEYGKMGIDPKKVIELVSGEDVEIYQTEKEKLNYIRTNYAKTIKSKVALETLLNSIQENGEVNDEFNRLYEEEEKERKEKMLKLVESRNKEILEQQKKAQEYAQNFQEQVKELGWRKPKIDKIQKEIFERDDQGVSLFERKLIHIANKSPKALAQLADFMLNYKEDKGEFDLSSFKKVESQEAKRVKSEWEQLLDSNPGMKTGNRNGKSKIPTEFYLP